MNSNRADKFQCQLDFIPLQKLDKPITIIGVGAIGSFTALTLAKMGFSEITVFDDDKVELHNLPNQFYRESDIGEYKVVALQNMVKDFTGTTLKIKPEKYDHQPLAGIVISGVDNMDTRIRIWEIVKYTVAVHLYIEARMGGETMQVFAVNPGSVIEEGLYESSLYPNSEAAHIPCGERSIMYTILHISAFISNVVKQFINEQPYWKGCLFNTKTNMIVQNMLPGRNR